MHCTWNRAGPSNNEAFDSYTPSLPVHSTVRALSLEGLDVTPHLCCALLDLTSWLLGPGMDVKAAAERWYSQSSARINLQQPDSTKCKMFLHTKPDKLGYLRGLHTIFPRSVAFYEQNTTGIQYNSSIYSHAFTAPLTAAGVKGSSEAVEQNARGNSSVLYQLSKPWASVLFSSCVFFWLL